MMDVRFRPLVRWPKKETPSHKRKHSPFRAKYTDTLDKLETELTHLKATSIVIEAAVTLKDIRNDGNLRADARPKNPGIILSFDSKHGPLALPCDRYNDWRANLRAIAYYLEYLRKADSYEVATLGETYKGWEQLPPPAPQTDFSSVYDAADYLVNLANKTTTFAGMNFPVDRLLNRQIGPDICNTIYRLLAKKYHPDAQGNGGNAEEFRRIKNAVDMLRAAYSQEET